MHGARGPMHVSFVLIFQFVCFLLQLKSSYCILGQVWCLIVSISDLCPLSYFVYDLHV